MSLVSIGILWHSTMLTFSLWLMACVPCFDFTFWWITFTLGSYVFTCWKISCNSAICICSFLGVCCFYFWRKMRCMYFITATWIFYKYNLRSIFLQYILNKYGKQSSSIFRYRQESERYHASVCCMRINFILSCLNAWTIICMKELSVLF